jgi:hypothetical protein
MITSHSHTFIFDVNFSYGSESVFTLKDQELNPPFPPIEGYLLETDNTPLLLTTGQPMALA